MPRSRTEFALSAPRRDNRSLDQLPSEAEQSCDSLEESDLSPTSQQRSPWYDLGDSLIDCALSTADSPVSCRPLGKKLCRYSCLC